MTDTNRLQTYARPVVVCLASLTLFFWLSRLPGLDLQDLFIYRAGSGLPTQGASPYDTEQLRIVVAKGIPHREELPANCGYFLPPQAILLMRPFTWLPWEWNPFVWVSLSFAVLCFGLLRIPTAPEYRAIHLVTASAALFNPVLNVIITYGQSSILTAGSIMIGYRFLLSGRVWLGSIFWLIPFIKPHLALPLVPLAFFIGGTRAGWALLGIVALTNAVGCLMTPDPVGLPGEYFHHLASGHKLVSYNRVEDNPQISSWNSLLVGLGGPVVELSVILIIAGYLVVSLVGLAVCRGRRPSEAWVLALGVSASVVCCQVLEYELIVLVGVFPLIHQRAEHGVRWGLIPFAVAWGILSVPAALMSDVMSYMPTAALANFAASYRSLGAMLMLITVLMKSRKPA